MEHSCNNGLRMNNRVAPLFSCLGLSGSPGGIATMQAESSSSSRSEMLAELVISSRPGTSELQPMWCGTESLSEANKAFMDRKFVSKK